MHSPPFKLLELVSFHFAKNNVFLTVDTAWNAKIWNFTFHALCKESTCTKMSNVVTGLMKFRWPHSISFLHIPAWCMTYCKSTIFLNDTFESCIIIRFDQSHSHLNSLNAFVPEHIAVIAHAYWSIDTYTELIYMFIYIFYLYGTCALNVNVLRLRVIAFYFSIVFNNYLNASKITLKKFWHQFRKETTKAEQWWATSRGQR